MTRWVGNVLVIEAEEDDKCEYCGKVAELRPDGKNGARICFECGMKDEEETKKNCMLVMAGPPQTGGDQQ